MSHRLLLIEETTSTVDSSLRESWADLRIVKADWASFVAETVPDQTVDLVVAVAVPPTTRSRGFFQWLLDHPIVKPTLAVLPGESEPELLRVASDAADDFILWPAHGDEWRQRITRILGSAERRSATARLMEEVGLAKLVGEDPAFRRTIEKIPLLARSGRPVLLTGETGTGKELCARAIHHLGSRRSFPFIPVDCGAFPDHLFENELFGHARGAFTDAHADQKGLIALAEGGTLFLDEIDALSLGAQAKLLRFLEERSYRPLGADRFSRANVNVLAATNLDPEALIREKRFRSDLYFRLNVLRLHLMPLRDRRGDIGILARHLVASLSTDTGVGHRTLTPPAIRKLMLHDWPGNVRELLNVLQRAVVFSEGTQILPSHISVPVADPSFEPPRGSFRQARASAIEAFERQYVEELLRKHRGNVTRASREAQKDRRAFGRLIKKYGISRRLEV